MEPLRQEFADQMRGRSIGGGEQLFMQMGRAALGVGKNAKETLTAAAVFGMGALAAGAARLGAASEFATEVHSADEGHRK